MMPGMVPWDGRNNHFHKPRSQESLAKVQKRTEKHRSGEVQERRNTRVPDPVPARASTGANKPEKIIIRLRDVATQTDPVYCSSVPTSKQIRDQVLTEERKIHNAKHTTRRRGAARPKPVPTSKDGGKATSSSKVDFNNLFGPENSHGTSTSSASKDVPNELELPSTPGKTIQHQSTVKQDEEMLLGSDHE